MAAGGFWAGRRVLVTGATGMVGSWLTKELVELGASTVALIRDPDPQSELYRSGVIRGIGVVSGVLEDFGAVERAINEHEIELVFHLGAQTIVTTAHRSPLPTLEANIRGTYNVLEACRRHAGLVRGVVIASSDKAYGEQEVLPYTEETPLGGRHPYEVSKSCADMISQAYHHTYGLSVAIARCGNIFGGGDLNWSRIVPGTIRSLFRGERPVIRSDGSYVRDYLYVRDAARAYMTLAERLGEPKVDGGGFNFSMESPLTVMQIVEEIQDLLGARDLEPQILSSATGEIRSQHLSSKKAREVLGWKPEHGLRPGLEQTIAWYRGYLA